MVNWSLNLIEKFGKVAVTAMVTLPIILISVSFAYLSSVILNHDTYPSVYLSILIPAIVAPPPMYFLITLAMRLGRVKKEVAAIMRSAGDALFIHDFSGRILEVNEASCVSLGYSREELLAMNVMDIGANYNPEKPIDFWQDLGPDEAVTREAVHRRKDGSTFPSEARLSVFNFGGESSVLALVRDISNRVKRRNDMQASEEKYRNLVETSHDLIWSVNESGIFTFVNAASKVTHGYEPEEMIGRAFIDFMTPEQAAIDIAVFAKIKEGVDHFDIESFHIRKDGLPVHLNFNAKVIRDEEGNVLGTTGSAREISERKKTEELMREHQDQMTHVTRIATLGEMATDIAHELNQPLAAISAFIDGSIRRLKSGEPPSERIIGALEKASEQAVRAGDVIHHLRDLVRRDERQTTKYNINDAIDKVLQLMTPDFNLKQIVLNLELAAVPPIVMGDPILLEQVVLNLVRNSVDVLGGVDDKVRELSISTEMSGNLVLIVIEDSGPGVDIDHQDRLFEPYFTTKKTGLGMGLPICRSIIDEHEGEILYKAAPGRGAMFEIRLPLSNAS